MTKSGKPVFHGKGVSLKKKIIFLMSVCMLLILGAAGCSVKSPLAARSSSSGSAMAGVTVKLLDVGQGDAALIRTPSQTILIDTGDLDEHPKFEAALRRENVHTVDKLIITHPHADHLGGASVVFKDCEVKAVYDNGQPANTKFYREYLRTIKAKGIAYKALRDGEVLDFGDGVEFEALSPTAGMVQEGGTKDGKVNLNLNSIVGRLVYGDFSMLFTGDAEKETEAGILQRHPAAAVKSLVLKAPHHGSKTASSLAYLKAVQPEAVLISCGAGNDYGHPHQPVLARYKKLGIRVWRTDEQGTITVASDGRTYSIEGER
jgi:competence protein ComEC